VNDDHYYTRLQPIVASVARQGSVSVFGNVPETTLDFLRRYGIRIVPNTETVGSTVLVFSYLQPADAAVFFDQIDGAENLVIFGRRPSDKAAIEKMAFAKGYRYHPAYFSHVDYEDRFDDGFWSILERCHVSTVGSDDADKVADMSRRGGSVADAEMARYAFLSRFIRPGDAVLESGSGAGYGANIIRTLSECATVVGRTVLPQAAHYASANFPQSGLKFETGDPFALDDHDVNSFDVVISFASIDDVRRSKRLIDEATRVLRPGGRFILGVRRAVTPAIREDVVSQVSQVLEIEELWLQNLTERKFTKTSSLIKGRDQDWLLIVAYKLPFVNTGIEFQDTIYPYPDPTKNFLAFERDYENPLLMRSLFGMGVRVSTPVGRDNIAKATMLHAAVGSADHGAALCVTGYRVLETGNSEDIRAFIQAASVYGDGQVLSPHAFRWKVSLTFLIGVMEQRLGNLANALKAFDAVIDSDWISFSPTLGTKAAEAAYRAGLIEMSREALPIARLYWLNGLDFARQIMAAPSSEIFGDDACPLPDSMRESIMALEIARKCADCLRSTSEHEYRSDYAAWRCMTDDQSMAAARNLASAQSVKASGDDAAKWRRLKARVNSHPLISKLVGVLRRFR
jgi:SAM-dependent methyltransferase